MVRPRNRGGKGRRRRARGGHHDRFDERNDNNNATMRDIGGNRDTGRGRPHHTRNWQWKDDWQPDDDLESEVDDNVDFLSDPKLPPLFADEDDDPVDDLPPVPHSSITRLLRKHQVEQNNPRSNRHRGNSKNNPFKQQPHQQQKPTNLNLPPIQRRQQQHQRHPKRSNSKYGCNGCYDCRAVRKANVRLRNALHNHLVAAAATLVEWSEDVGVPFGGTADDEMDWQPEPEIRVIVVQQQQQQQQQPDDRRCNNYYYTVGNHHPNGFPVTRFGRPGERRRHGGGGPGLSSGYSGVGAAAASWCQQPGVDSLEEEQGAEEPFEEPPEEPYCSMALEPDPFRATPSGSGFANTSGVSPFNQATTNPDPPNSSSGVVANHSAVSFLGGLVDMVTNAPSIEAGGWSQPNVGNQGGSKGHARGSDLPEVLQKYRVRY
ncbi:hypothetical protein PG993_010019 [Apiospora rasikravindrae]|uniref:Uncharacterized protein n=1 Tax=Apiospora rasikravindrae TaxID=990691 RepID=A0ABR1SL16_9PEZI